MNKNIKVVNKGLWVFNFDYVKLGYIKEVVFNETESNDPMCLRNDGTWMINSNYPDYHLLVPLIDAIIRLPDKLIKTRKGLIQVLKCMCPSMRKNTVDQIEKFITNYKLDSVVNSYHNMCDIELKRRKLKKEFKKGG